MENHQRIVCEEKCLLYWSGWLESRLRIINDEDKKDYDDSRLMMMVTIDNDWDD